ncbi:MAG: RagB/SusD family nutrient uptake outer membrane protein [Segetibacter sp.]|nr:RagB/SusD family nutrient uptake outer membrane protein [Segetibacter sp.]
MREAQIGTNVNEVYLISAEAKARTGNLAGALADLNTLLSKRWKTGTYTPFNATTQFDALSLILKERRKELPFTAALRWSDLRRLNIDSRFSTTLVRVLNGITFTLPPNHQKYTLPIPDAEIKLSGIQQNPR